MFLLTKSFCFFVPLEAPQCLFSNGLSPDSRDSVQLSAPFSPVGRDTRYIPEEKTQEKESVSFGITAFILDSFSMDEF